LIIARLIIAPFGGKLLSPGQEPRGQVLAGLGHGGATEALKILSFTLLPGAALGTRRHMVVAGGGRKPRGAAAPAAGEPAAGTSQQAFQQTH
jgi:hypothetical protein